MTMQIDRQSILIEAHCALTNRIARQGGPVPWEARAVSEERRKRSLQTGHRFKLQRRRKDWRATDGYVPELAARIDDDPNLTDGARRCARKIAEATYRQNREGRTLAVTVTYLAKALGRCRRTVQRYLRQLEDEGYIAVDVVTSETTRLCIGLAVRLLAPLLAGHHRERWPGALGNPGATSTSRNQSPRVKSIAKGDRIPVMAWAVRSMNGVFDSFMKTNPLAGLPSIASA